MDVKNKGITWDFYEKEQLSTISITAANRREYLRRYEEDFLRSVTESGEEITDETKKQAEEFAKMHVNFAKKAEKKYLKGHKFFNFKGKREAIPTFEKLSRLQSYLQDMEKRHIEQNKQEEE